MKGDLGRKSLQILMIPGLCQLPVELVNIPVTHVVMAEHMGLTGTLELLQLLKYFEDIF